MMKYFQAHIFSLFCWVALLLLQACYSAEDHISSILNRADSLMQSQADSALSLLEAIPSPEALPREQSAYYGLLLTQAQDKTYIVHTDDSLIRAASNYYDSTHKIALQAKAHYYWARVYQDNKNIPACVREYLTAVSKAEKAEENQIACLAYANLARIFYFEGLNLKADSCYLEAEKLSIQLNDTIRWAWVLAHRGENYLALGMEKYDKVKSKLNLAIKLSKILGQKSIERAASVSLSSLYSRLDSAELAVHYARTAISLNKNKPYYGGFLLLGDAFYQLGEYDSAKVYLTKSLATGLAYTKVGAYMRLSEIAEIEGRLKEAVRFKDSLNTYQDSVRLNQQNVAIVSAIKDMHISEINHNNSTFFNHFGSLFLFLFLILLTFIALFFYKRKKYSQGVLSAKLEGQKLKTKLSHKLEQKNVEIEHLQCTLKQIETSNGHTSDLRMQIKQLEKEKSQILKSLLKYADVYVKIRRIIHYYKQYNDYSERFEREDWLCLSESVDPSGNFKRSLLACNQFLDEDDINLCYLLKMNISVIDISIIMECTRDNVYKKKKSLICKLMPFPQQKDLIDFFEEISSNCL